MPFLNEWVTCKIGSCCTNIPILCHCSLLLDAQLHLVLLHDMCELSGASVGRKSRMTAGVFFCIRLSSFSLSYVWIDHVRSVWSISNRWLKWMGHAMAQAPSHWHLTAETWVHSQFRPYQICSAQNGTRTGFSPSNLVFPGHFHYTHAPCSFSHQSLTLYNFSNLQSC
jgi:hypothetical protein